MLAVRGEGAAGQDHLAARDPAPGVRPRHWARPPRLSARACKAAVTKAGDNECRLSLLSMLVPLVLLLVIAFTKKMKNVSCEYDRLNG